jgi:SAM-dependent methyltransferase
MHSEQGSLRHRAAQGRTYAELQHSSSDQGAALEFWKFRGCVAPDQTVLDFGCGDGALLELLPGARKIGIEISPRARSYVASRGLETYEATEKVESNIADVVISHHSLEHTLSPLGELRELRRVLKPLGYLHLWLPIDDWRVQRRVGDELDNDHHLYTWTPRLIANLLREAGFELERVEVVTHARHPRVTPMLHRVLPSALHRPVGYSLAFLLRRRQLHVLARRPA